MQHKQRNVEAVTIEDDTQLACKLKYSRISFSPYTMTSLPLNWLIMRAPQAYCSQLTYDSLRGKADLDQKDTAACGQQS